MATRDPRFFLPGSLGQSWQVRKNFRDICLTEVADYFNEVMNIKINYKIEFSQFDDDRLTRNIFWVFILQSTKRLHLKSEVCPMLLRTEVQNLFPGSECYNPHLTKITLSYKHFDDKEKAQKYVSLMRAEKCKVWQRIILCKCDKRAVCCCMIDLYSFIASLLFLH